MGALDDRNIAIQQEKEAKEKKMGKNLTQAEKQQAAFEETQRELSLMNEEMWDLLKKVTTTDVGGVYAQLDMIEEAARIASDVRKVMDAQNAITERRMKRERAKEKTDA